MSQALLAYARLPDAPKVPERLALASGGVLEPDPDAPQTLVEALSRTASRFPERGLRFITAGRETVEHYPALLEKALRVAGGLAAQGLRPGDRIILQVDALSSHFVAFWGCLLAGIAPVTVAIAPSYKERNGITTKLHNVWTLLDHPWILTTKPVSQALKGLEQILPVSGLKTLCLEDFSQRPRDAIPHRGEPDDVAFLQLSSGSTGVPKCIQETHRGILSHIFAARAFNRYGPHETSLNWLPLDHVVPILTFHLRDVCLGYDQLHVQTDLVLSNPLLWLDLIQEHRITQTWAPNFGFKLVSDRLSRAPGRAWDLSSVKRFMNAGEQVTMPVLRAFLESVRPFGVAEAAMQPAFGMAEVCTCMTYANQFSLKSGSRRFSKDSLEGRLRSTDRNNSDCVEFVSLGRPVPGVLIRITDASNQPLPEEVIGRLQIKGTVVTPGYLNNPQANAEAFVGAGWFNSGDLGFIYQGELFLTGREKEMIIIRGAKYYCYEIEDVVSQVPGVEPTFAAACSTADPSTGTEQLSIFFVPQPEADPARVREAIRTSVSAGLGITPRVVLPLARAEFPKTTSGKIQRTQLKQNLEAGAFADLVQRWELKVGKTSDGLPITATEKRISELWKEVLDLSDVPVNRSLFALGGDSLKAIQIISRLRETFRVEFPLAILFEDDATVRSMASWVDAALKAAPTNALPPLVRRSSPPEAPVSASSSQLRIWLADEMQPGTALHNICRALHLKGPLDRDALEQALTGIVARHEMFRTVFRFDASLKQLVGPLKPVPLTITNLQAIPRSAREAQLSEQIQAEANEPFDLRRGPLFRARLFATDPEQHLLLVTFHQIVVDGWSIPVFYRELADLYLAALEARPGRLPPLPIQYADFAAWQERWMSDGHLANQFAYWRDRLNFAGPQIRLSGPATEATDSAAAQPDTESKAPVTQLRLTAALTAALRQFTAREGQTLFVTLLTLYKWLIHRCSGNEEIIVGSPAAGRTRLETEGLIGFFVNTLLLRTSVTAGLTFRELSQRVRETATGAFAHSEAPFERVIQSRPNTFSDRRRWFQFWFAPIDAQLPFEMGALKAVPEIVFPGGAQFDLALFVSETSEGLVFYFERQPQVLRQDQMDEFVHQFEHLLQAGIASPDVPLEKLCRQCSTQP